MSRVHSEDRVNGAFHYARDITDDVGHGHQVLVIDALVGDAVLDPHQLAQRNQR
jgi:hypothetical protein